MDTTLMDLIAVNCVGFWATMAAFAFKKGV